MGARGKTRSRNTPPHVAVHTASSALTGKLARVIAWEHTWLVLILLVTFSLHIAAIGYPRDLILDERFYVPDAQSIIQDGVSLRPEHPPLGKLMITTGILIFGDNPIGWRLLPALFGTALIFLFYRVCRELNLPREGALFATFLLAFENMTFVQSSVAMLDVYGMVFMLAGFLLYFRSRYPASGAMLALSAVTKISGIVSAPIVFFHWFFTGRPNRFRFLASLCLFPLFFLFFFFIFQSIMLREVVNPFQSIKTMLDLSGSITFANSQHPSASRPWDWIIWPQIMPFWYDPHYVSALNHTIWVLIIPVVAYLAVMARRGNSAAVFGFTWFAGTFLTWIPLSLITDRLSYVFYFYPAIGAICLGLGLALSRLLEWRRKLPQGRLKDASLLLVAGYCQLHFIIFVILSPFSSPWLKFYT